MPRLVRLEDCVFATDRVSARGFRRFMRRDPAGLCVAESADAARDALLGGYALVLFRRASTEARLYSIAVAPEMRGIGLGRRLLAWAESVAIGRGCSRLRLEVRRDDAGAQRFYRAAGYAPFALRAGFYEDGGDAVRMRRRLHP